MSNVSDGIGARMKRSRKERGVIQAKAAEMIGVSGTAYKNYENGRTELPLSGATRFCECFGVDLKWLVYGSISASGSGGPDFVRAVFEAVFAEMTRRGSRLSEAKIGMIGSYVFARCSDLSGDPVVEAAAVFDLVEC